MNLSKKNIVLRDNIPKQNKFDYICPHCGFSFARKYTLTRHLNGNKCKMVKKESHIEIEEKMAFLEKQIHELKDELKDEKQKNDREIAELKEKPLISNQILQVVCVGNNDNYLDMLTEEWGNFNLALEYIKDCALSNLSGDCKLIKRMYLTNGTDVHFIDKSRTRIEYFNEKKEKMIDSKELFGRKLANNLQNSYLKGVNYLITKNLDDHCCPQKFLDDYDLQTWNQHIYDLSDVRYHKKIVNQLEIPG